MSCLISEPLSDLSNEKTAVPTSRTDRRLQQASIIAEHHQSSAEKVTVPFRLHSLPVRSAL